MKPSAEDAVKLSREIHLHWLVCLIILTEKWKISHVEAL